MKLPQKLCIILVAITTALPLLCMEEAAIKKMWDTDGPDREIVAHVLDADPNSQIVKAVCAEPSVNKALTQSVLACTAVEKINEKCKTQLTPGVYLDLGTTPGETAAVCTTVKEMEEYQANPRFKNLPFVTPTVRKNLPRHVSKVRTKIQIPAPYNAELTTPERCVKLVENTGLATKALKAFGLGFLGTSILLIGAVQGDGTISRHTISASIQSAAVMGVAVGLASAVHTLGFDEKHQLHNSWGKTKYEKHMLKYDKNRDVIFDTKADE
jgi:hypothetical protein